VTERVEAEGVSAALSRTETTGLVRTGATLSCTDATFDGMISW